MHGCENDILYNGVIRGTRIHFIDSEKRLKKRMVTGSILLLFVISIIAVIFVVDISDDSSASYPSASEVYVDDNLYFTESELYYDGVFITNDPTNAVASYDPNTGTLTLNGYHSGGIGSTSDSGLVVKLINLNSISTPQLVDDYSAIKVKAGLTVIGNSDSELIIKETIGMPGKNIVGITSEYYVQKGGRVYINKDNNGTFDKGIVLSGNIRLESGLLNIHSSVALYFGNNLNSNMEISGDVILSVVSESFIVYDYPSDVTHKIDLKSGGDVNISSSKYILLERIQLGLSTFCDNVQYTTQNGYVYPSSSGSIIFYYDGVVKVTYNLMGKGSSFNENFNVGEKITAIAPVFKGYIFDKWYKDKDLTILWDFNDILTKDITLYAKWNPISYEIKFDGNGHTEGKMNHIDAYYDISLMLPSNSFEKTGYNFTGWAVDKNSEVKFVNLSTVINLTTENNDEITLYAKWSPIQYTVEFNKTSGTGSMSSINMTYDRSVNLPKNSFENPGYNFMGWSDKNGGEVKYSDQQSVKNLTETDSQTLTLYAVWSVGKYTLSFNTDGGTSISPIIKEYGESIGAVPDPERSGYVFSGWEPKIPLTMPSDNLTVSAKWSVEKYTISFNTDGGSHIPSITGEYGASVSIPNSPTRTGYDFEGWDRNIPTTIPSENVTLNAIWVPREYTIVFDSDGGSTLPTITLKYGEKIGAVEPPKKSGYSFVGWDRKVPETMPAEDLIITALWAEGIADPLAEGSEVWKEGNLTYIENETVTSGEDGSVTTERILTATDSEGKIVFTLMSTIIKSPGEKAVYVIESRTDSKGTVTTKTAELTANVSEVPFVDENSLFELDLIAGDDTDYEVVINIEGNRFFFTEELLTYLAERECSVQLKSDVFSVSYDKNVVVKLSRGGDTEFLFDAVNPEMTDRQMDAVGDNMAVSIDLLSSEGYIDGLGGISEISMLFDPGAGTDANRLKVFHADVEGNITGKDTDYDHESDMITFYTDHHSVFFIDETEGPKESGVPIIPIVIAVVVILAAVAGGFIYLKGRSVPEESPKMPPKAFRK